MDGSRDNGNPGEGGAGRPVPGVTDIGGLLAALRHQVVLSVEADTWDEVVASGEVQLALLAALAEARPRTLAEAASKTEFIVEAVIEAADGSIVEAEAAVLRSLARDLRALDRGGG
jgi:hypothetical protein